MSHRNQAMIDESELMARKLQSQLDAEWANEEDEDDYEEDSEELEARNRRRNRNKKGRRRQRREASKRNNNADFDILDNFDFASQPYVFSREHFRRMIKKTFDDYYPLEFNRSTFNMDEYLAVMTQE